MGVGGGTSVGVAPGIGMGVGIGNGVGVGSGVGSGAGVGVRVGDCVGVGVGNALPAGVFATVIGSPISIAKSAEHVPSIFSKADHSSAVAVRFQAAFTCIQLTAYSHQ